MALALPYAVALAEAAQSSEQESSRAVGTALSVALEDLAELLGERFLRAEGDVDRIVRLYALDHGHDPGGWATDRGAEADR